MGQTGVGDPMTPGRDPGDARERVREALKAFGGVVAKFDPATFARHWPTLAAQLPPATPYSYCEWCGWSGPVYAAAPAPVAPPPAVDARIDHALEILEVADRYEHDELVSALVDVLAVAPPPGAPLDEREHLVTSALRAARATLETCRKLFGGRGMHGPGALEEDCAFAVRKIDAALGGAPVAPPGLAVDLAEAEVTALRVALCDLWGLYFFRPDCAACEERRESAGDSAVLCIAHQGERHALYERLRPIVQAAQGVESSSGPPARGGAGPTDEELAEAMWRTWPLEDESASWASQSDDTRAMWIEWARRVRLAPGATGATGGGA